MADLGYFRVQVFVSYGEKTSGELLLSYGFSPSTANPHDARELQLGLHPADPQRAAKGALLHSRGLQESVSFPLKLAGWPTGMLRYAAFVALRTDTAQELAWVAAELWDKGTFPSLKGKSIELLAVNHVAGLCKAALGAYPSSMASDRALAEQPPPPLQGSSPTEAATRERIIVTAKIRVQERRILQRTVFMLTERRRQLW